MREGTGESKLAVRCCSERKSSCKTGKGLSWQGEEHAKLEMRELGIETVIVLTVRSHHTVLRILDNFHSNLSTIIGLTRLHS